MLPSFKVLLKTSFLLCIIMYTSHQLSYAQPVSTQFSLAKQAVTDSQYVKANEYFLSLANRDTILPDDYCFYFGISLYNSSRTTLAKAFFNKYLSIIDTEHPSYKETLHYLALLGDNEAQKEYHILSTPDSVKHVHAISDTVCEGYDQVICPICNGVGVIIENTNFGKVYQVCKYSDDQGMMTCEQYKAYLRGELKKED